MTALTTHYLPVNDSNEIQNILRNFSQATQLVYKQKDGTPFAVVSYQNIGNKFKIQTAPSTPSNMEGQLYFRWQEIAYYFEGKLENSIFIPEYLYREQKRKLPRLIVPENYPASFALESINNSEKSMVFNILDLHGDGLKIYTSTPQKIKSNDMLHGKIKISKFPEVKIAGLARHVYEKDGKEYAGIEIQHLIFSSEDKLRELLLFYRADVFYFNQKK